MDRTPHSLHRRGEHGWCLGCSKEQRDDEVELLRGENEELRRDVNYLRARWESKTGQSEMWDDLEAARAEVARLRRERDEARRFASQAQRRSETRLIQINEAMRRRLAAEEALAEAREFGESMTKTANEERNEMADRLAAAEQREQGWYEEAVAAHAKTNAAEKERDALAERAEALEGALGQTTSLLHAAYLYKGYATEGPLDQPAVTLQLEINKGLLAPAGEPEDAGEEGEG